MGQTKSRFSLASLTCFLIDLVLKILNASQNESFTHAQKRFRKDLRDSYYEKIGQIGVLGEMLICENFVESNSIYLCFTLQLFFNIPNAFSQVVAKTCDMKTDVTITTFNFKIKGFVLIFDDLFIDLEDGALS